MAYSINTALQSGLFDRVVVSTDDPEITALALLLGAEVPFARPIELADDHASTLAVMQHAVRACRTLGWSIKHVCCLYATAPFVEVGDLRAGLQLLEASDKEDLVQYVFTATGFGFPVQRAIRLDSSGGIQPVWPENIPKRSQDLELLFHDAGQFYWGRASAFDSMLPLFAQHSRAVLLPSHRVQDIDNEEDWIRAEWLYRAWKESVATP